MSSMHEARLVMDLPEHYTEQDLRVAYRELVRVWHPDRFSSDAELTRRAERKTKEITAAYALLKRQFAAKNGPERAPAPTANTWADLDAQWSQFAQTRTARQPREPVRPPPAAEEDKRATEAVELSDSVFVHRVITALGVAVGLVAFLAIFAQVPRESDGQDALGKSWSVVQSDLREIELRRVLGLLPQWTNMPGDAKDAVLACSAAQLVRDLDASNCTFSRFSATPRGDKTCLEQMDVSAMREAAALPCYLSLAPRDWLLNRGYVNASYLRSASLSFPQPLAEALADCETDWTVGLLNARGVDPIDRRAASFSASVTPLETALPERDSRDIRQSCLDRLRSQGRLQ